MTSFNEVCIDVTKTARKIPQSDYLVNGKYKIFDQGKDYIGGYTDDDTGIVEEYPYIVFGDHTRIIKFVNEPCFIGADGVKLLKVYNLQFLPKYVYYSLVANPIVSIGYSRHFKYLKEQSIRDCSIDEQKRIITELENHEKAISIKKESLSSLDELVKSRFIEMFGDIVRNDKSWATEIITKVCPIKQYDGRITECDGKIWLLNLDLVESNTGVILDKYYVAKTEIGNSTITFSEDNVLYSKLRPYLNKVVVPDGNGYATSELIPFFPLSQVNKYYLAYALRSESFVTLINSKAGGAKMPRAPMDFIRSFPLPVPPIELQNEFAEFVKLIDKSKFVCHSKNFLCDIFTFSSSTIAYPSVVSIFVCPKRC